MNKLLVLACLIALTGCVTNQITPEQHNAWKTECLEMQENSPYKSVYANGECLNYSYSSGKKTDEINILIHGSWDRGSDPLGRSFSTIAHY